MRTTRGCWKMGVFSSPMAPLVFWEVCRSVTERYAPLAITQRVEEQRIQRVSLLPLRPFRYLHKCDRDASASPLPVHRLLLLVAAVCHSRYQNGDVPAVGDLDVLHSRQSHCAYIIASVIPSSITGTDRRMWWVEWSSVR